MAVFALGPREDTEEAFARSRAQFERSLAEVAWVQPIGTAMFGGADPPKKEAHRDAWDWSVIEAWPDGLADGLTTAVPPHRARERDVRDD